MYKPRQNHPAQKQNLTDFQSLAFFQQFKQQIHKIAQQNKQDRLQRKIAKTQKIISQSSKEQANQYESIYENSMFMNNLLIDYLKSKGYNYTYPVLMRQSNIISQELVSKKKLANLAEIEQEYNKTQRLNVSILQLILGDYHKKYRNSTKSKQYKQQDVQVQLINRSGNQNNLVLSQNKIRQIREQVQSRERQYYKKQLDSFCKKELLQQKMQVIKQQEQKYQKYKLEIYNKNAENIKQINVDSQQYKKLKQYNENVTNKNYQLVLQVKKLNGKIQELEKWKIKHDCTKSQEYKEMVKRLENQGKLLENKRKQFDFAIRNVNTKVEDLLDKKRKVQDSLGMNDNPTKTDKFIEQNQKTKANKDYMIETLYSQMKQLDQRVKILAQQNIKLRDSIKEMKIMIRNKDEQIQRTRSLVEFWSEGVDENDGDGDMRVDSIIKGIADVSNQGFSKSDAYGNVNFNKKNIYNNVLNNQMSDIVNNNTKQHRQVLPSSYEPIIYNNRNNNSIDNRNMLNNNRKNPVTNPNRNKQLVCKQCQKRKQKQSINICIGVTEQDLLEQTHPDPKKTMNNTKDKQQEQKQQESPQSQSDFQQKIDRQLEYDKKLAVLRADMNIIKNKVMMLVGTDLYM